MVENLKNRSLVDKVFVSQCCDADQPLKTRDTNAEAIEETEENKTGFLEFLHTTRKEVIVVVLDYAGLTTNVQDLKEFVSEHNNISKIIVDRIPITTEVEIYETEQLLQDPEAIKNV